MRCQRVCTLVCRALIEGALRDFMNGGFAGIDVCSIYTVWKGKMKNDYISFPITLYYINGRALEFS